MGFPRGWTDVFGNAGIGTHKRRTALGSTYHCGLTAHVLKRCKAHFAGRSPARNEGLRVCSPCDGIGGLLIALVRLGMGHQLATYLTIENNADRNHVVTVGVARLKAEARRRGGFVMLNGEGPFPFNPELELVQLFLDPHVNGDLAKLPYDYDRSPDGVVPVEKVLCRGTP